jgi:UDP-glucose 4-epimerase
MELLKQNIETISYDLTECSSLPFQNVKYIVGDILDKEKLVSAMDGCDAVFHTAAVADINIVRDIPEQTMEINVLGTTKCLQAARECSIKRFLFASSVYASGNYGSFYSISKRAGESLCKVYYEEFGLGYTILRYGSLYGNDANHWNFIYNMCKELLLTGTFTYTSSPESMREYIHILDAARESVEIAWDPEFINKTVMITGHQKMKLKELFAMIEEIIGKSVEITYIPREKHHYIMTPYSFEWDTPIRVNFSQYVDISEGILGCLNKAKIDIENEKRKSS